MWCLAVSTLCCMVLPMPVSALPDGVWIWVRAAARAGDYSKQADMDEDSSLGKEQKDRV